MKTENYRPHYEGVSLELADLAALQPHLSYSWQPLLINHTPLSLVGSLCPSLPLLQPSFPPQSTLGFVALVLSTLHTLTYGWTRPFEESRYKFFLPRGG